MTHFAQRALPPAERERLAKLLALLDSPHHGERDGAVAAATRLLARHGMRWCEVLQPQPQLPKRAPEFGTWRATCQALMRHPGNLRPWERRFVADLPGFRRISTKQRCVLAEIAERVLGQAAA